MAKPFQGDVRRLAVEFEDPAQLRKRFLSSAPHGGLLLDVDGSLLVGEAVILEVRCQGWKSPVEIRGAVLFCRRGEGASSQVGVGFFSSEVDKREKLLGTPPPSDQTLRERREQRFATTLKVTYQTATDFVVDYTRNISTGGIFVGSRRAPEVGSTILFKLYPPGHEDPIDLPGQVAWLRPGAGFGVRFSAASTAARTRLDRLVRSVAIGAPATLGAPVFEEVTPV